jgi:hypothetical protein
MECKAEGLLKLQKCLKWMNKWTLEEGTCGYCIDVKG